MRWRRRRFQRMRKRDEVLLPEDEKTYRRALKRFKDRPLDLRKVADMFEKHGYVQHASLLRKLAHTFEEEAAR
jgi:hypothetical protein